jgi:hypothetical protein
MDFCAQSAFAAADRLGFAVFFWAPALCWWARTIVLSLMAYSLSASAAKISNIFFQMPLLAQREIVCGSLSDHRSAPAGPAREYHLSHWSSRKAYRRMGQHRIKLTPDESRKSTLGNPLIEDRP